MIGAAMAAPSRVFIAHPFGDTDAAGRFHLWARCLIASVPDHTFVFPPFGLGFIGTADSRQARAHVRERAAGCAGVVLVGGVVTREMTFAVDVVHRAGGWIANMTSLGELPPPTLEPDCIERFRWQRSDDPGAGLVVFESPRVIAGDSDPCSEVVDFVAWLGRPRRRAKGRTCA